ncbi:hypothetical protein N7481_003743 [Penicillium waksmanii]|uniref:uncharacterized protein n=1 Tax=Penicillium waksmanii TaxID=69791 RepID=UPI002548C4B9|nr:uncharacterized protein N7481_003743 [Penicillium waksmanii]KAJ5988533.1 hypothetical protein N7481_003743 [Penicillium waksmanii]
MFDARVLIECVRSHFDHDTDGNPAHGEAFTQFLFDKVLSLLKGFRLPIFTRRRECKQMGKTEYTYPEAEWERNIAEESPLGATYLNYLFKNRLVCAFGVIGVMEVLRPVESCMISTAIPSCRRPFNPYPGSC